MKVALLEFIDEFETFSTYVHRNNLEVREFLIVAFEPKLQAYLKNQNIEFQNTLPYFTNDSHKRMINETEKVVEIVRTEFNFVDSNGLEECYKENFACYLRNFVTHLFKLIEIIGNIHNKYSNVRFWACVSKRTSPSILVGEDERYLGVLAERFCRSRKIDFVNLNEERVDSAATMQLALSERGKQHFGILEEVFALAMVKLFRRRKLILIPGIPRKGNTFNGLVSKIYSLDKKISFVTIDNRWKLLKCAGYNVFSFLSSFFSMNGAPNYCINIAHLNKEPKDDEKVSLNRNIECVLRKISDDKPDFLGVSFPDLVKNKTKCSFKKYLENMLLDSHNLNFALNMLERQFVMSYSARDLMSVAGELSKVAGKKSLFVSHGTHPVPVDAFHEVELYNLCKGFMLGTYTHVALSTPVQEKHLVYFKKRYPEISNQTIKTGPLAFAQFDNFDRESCRSFFGLQDGEILIMHATTTRTRSGERFHCIETLDEFFSSLTDIIQAVNAIDGAKLVIKLHPGFPLSNQEINSLLRISEKIVLCRDKPFAEVLSATDILISYSSTAIDEALINRIPVMLYDKWCRYNHFGTSIYNETEIGNLFPVCYVNKNENLGNAIDYLKRMITSTRRDKMDIRDYSYDDDYAQELSTFLGNTLTV